MMPTTPSSRPILVSLVPLLLHLARFNLGSSCLGKRFWSHAADLAAWLTVSALLLFSLVNVCKDVEQNSLWRGLLMKCPTQFRVPGEDRQKKKKSRLRSMAGLCITINDPAA